MITISDLSKLKRGQTATVECIEECALTRRMAELGIVGGTNILCIANAAFGGPSAYLVRGALIALRREGARAVYVRDVGGGERKWA